MVPDRDVHVVCEVREVDLTGHIDLSPRHTCAVQLRIGCAVLESGLLDTGTEAARHLADVGVQRVVENAHVMDERVLDLGHEAVDLGEVGFEDTLLEICKGEVLPDSGLDELSGVLCELCVLWCCQLDHSFLFSIPRAA